MDFNTSSIGNRISSIRIAKGISQRELGRRAGISGQMISKIENNITNPSLETLKKIADALDTNVIFLQGDLETFLSWKIGETLSTERHRLKLTLEEMANKLELPLKIYSNYENNTLIPNSETLSKICDKLELSEWDFVEFSDDKNFSQLLNHSNISGSIPISDELSDFLTQVETLYNLSTNKDEFISSLRNGLNSSHFNIKQKDFINLIDNSIKNSKKLANSLDFLDDLNLSMDNTLTLRKTTGKDLTESEKDILVLLTSSHLQLELGYNFDELCENPKLLKEILNRIHQVIRTEINIYNNK